MTADATGKNNSDFDRLTAALAASGDVVYAWDLADDSIVWHGSLGRLFAGDTPPATGADLAARIYPEDQPQRSRRLDDHLARGVAYDCEFRLAGRDGTAHWVHDRGSVVPRGPGASPCVMGTMRPISSRKETEARLYYLANYDDLTGHFNKARLSEALNAELRRALREGSAGAFAVLGVDQLAMINSAYGYEAGDAVLVAVAQRLSARVRGSDVIGRIGGDRFGILLTDCGRCAAHRAAERAVEAVHGEAIDTPGGPVRITVTAGVVTFPAQSCASAEILAKAESALREAKQQGRNQTGVYEMTEAQRAAYREALSIGADIEAAMQNDRLCFAYQPIVDARTGAPHSYECLLRLRRTDGSVATAGSFIPAIEELGLMRAVERQVMDLAVADLERRPGPTLAINISGPTTSDPAWLRRLGESLQRRPDVAGRLVVEITETAALHDIAETLRFVKAIRNMGVRVALDDFGAGFTTFQHLKTLPVDIVKIDGSFVRNIDHDQQNRLFVRNLIDLAHSLEVLALAECVETGAEAAALSAEGADLLQGYHIGRPALTPPDAASIPDSAAADAGAHDRA